jgi:hypothetical protein
MYSFWRVGPDCVLRSPFRCLFSDTMLPPRIHVGFRAFDGSGYFSSRTWCDDDDAVFVSLDVVEVGDPTRAVIR